MLNSKERHRVLLFLRHCSILCLFPIEVDVRTWKVRHRADTTWKTWACKGSYVLFIAHSSYKATSLLHTLLFGYNVPLHQVLLHGVVASAAVMLAYWYYVLYIQCADVNAELVRTTLQDKIVGGKMESRFEFSNC